MKTTKQIFQKHNNSILIPEKGSHFEYEKGIKFTDPNDIAFEYPFECSLPHLLSDKETDEHLFI